MFRLGNGLVSDLLDDGRNPHCLNLLQGSVKVPDVLNMHLSQSCVSLVHVIVANLGLEICASVSGNLVGVSCHVPVVSVFLLASRRVTAHRHSLIAIAVVKWLGMRRSHVKDLVDHFSGGLDEKCKRSLL